MDKNRISSSYNKKVSIKSGDDKINGELLVYNNLRMFRSPVYNWDYNMLNGFVQRWGVTKKNEDDPLYSPFGPEILDLEISTVCHGIKGKPCKWCYKSNTGVGENMKYETFVSILDKMPLNLTQIAFGIGDIDGNPDMFKMFEYCWNNKRNQVVPNLTINGEGLTDEHVRLFSSLCGAIAVSRYSHAPEVCYSAVDRLLKAGLKQTNIHMLMSEDTYDDCWKVVDDYQKGIINKDLNAIVFLFLKPKGKRNNLKSITYEKFSDFVKYCFNNDIPIGFDSCSSPFVMKIASEKNLLNLFNIIEACESSRFSSYINYLGEYWHCSFTEGNEQWKPINVLEYDDFLKDVWFNEELVKFRKKVTDQKPTLSKDCYCCPVFPDLYQGMKF